MTKMMRGSSKGTLTIEDFKELNVSSGIQYAQDPQKDNVLRFVSTFCKTSRDDFTPIISGVNSAYGNAARMSGARILHQCFSKRQ